MSILSGIYSWFFKRRMEEILFFHKEPYGVQEKQLHYLIDTAKDTYWGKQHGYGSIKALEHFKQQVPIQEYNDAFPFIERAMKGEADVLWPGIVKWFAKSSGTTHAKSKFIPVTQESLDDTHFKGGKDMYGTYFFHHDDAKLADGKSLVVGGSHEINKLNSQSSYGDLSAVLLQNLPFWAELLRTPDLKTALMSEWEAKIEAMAEKTSQADVTNVVGVPTWTVVLFNRILEITGKSCISEVWPNLELYIHGGVSFQPYRSLFKRLIGGKGINYLETYNASEGNFALQDDCSQEGMLLMLDYGIFYEFIPMSELGKEQPKTIGLDQVELHKSYALVISTNGGLWRYMIGDTIRFVSKEPFRITVSGRTKHFINAFGEELIIENADNAIAQASEKHGCLVSDYTAAPVYFSEHGSGAHEWLIEFKREPRQLEAFVTDLDEALKSLNTDYQAKRHKGMALSLPVVHQLQPGSFHNWLKSKGKLGGQNKVPRLSNNRDLIEEVKAYLGI